MRHSFCIGLLDRPLFLALVFGYATGAWDVVLPAGIVLELLWLDVVPLGSVVPPLNFLSFWLFVPLCLHYRWTTPEALMLPLFLALLCAYLGSWLECRLRLWHNAGLEPVQRWLAGADVKQSPRRLTYAAIGQRFVMHMLVYSGLAVLYMHSVALLYAQNWLPVAAGLTWPVVYTVAAVGAVLSLRTQRAYILLGALLVLIVLHVFFLA